MPYSTDETRKLAMLFYRLTQEQYEVYQDFEVSGFEDPADDIGIAERAYRTYSHLEEAINLLVHALNISVEELEAMLWHRFVPNQWWQSQRRLSNRQRNVSYFKQLASNLLALEEQGREEEVAAQWELHGKWDCTAAILEVHYPSWELPSPDIPTTPDLTKMRHAAIATNIRQASMPDAIIPMATLYLGVGELAKYQNLHQMVVELRSYDDCIEFEHTLGIQSFDLLAWNLATGLNQANPHTASGQRRYSDLEESLNLVLQSTPARTPVIDHWPNRFTEEENLPF